MTRKHYILLARTIRAQMEKYDYPDDTRELDAIRALVNELCITLKADNQDFDREKFQKATIHF